MRFTTEQREIICEVEGAYSRFSNLEKILITERLSPQVENKDLYTLDEVAGILSMSVITIRQYVRTGKLKAIKKWRSWYVSSNQIAKLAYEREHGKTVQEGETMLVLMDTSLDNNAEIVEHHFLTIDDLLEVVKEPTVLGIQRYVGLIIPNPQQTVFIECVSNIDSFYRRTGQLPIEPAKSQKSSGEIHQLVIDAFNNRTKEVKETLKAAYRKSLRLYPSSNVIRLYMDEYGDLREFEIPKNDSAAIEVNAYLLYEFDCLDISLLMEDKEIEGHFGISFIDLIKGKEQEFAAFLLHEGVIKEKLEYDTLPDIFLAIIDTYKPRKFIYWVMKWDYQIYKQMKIYALQLILQHSIRVQQAWVEILSRYEFIDVIWNWEEEQGDRNE